ncbi:putative Lunapark domain-containing protein [Dioscorea sansibarensis]
MAEEAVGEEPKQNPKPEQEKKEKRRGFLSRLWRGVFGGRSEDYEKKLQYLSKEEASVHARMKRRARTSKKMARDVIFLAFLLEIAAVGFSIIATRGVDLSWQMRAVRVLPIFVVPVLAFAMYTAIVNLTRIFDQKDEKTLERLRAERKAKIDELKERTNYYSTQQLIQRYDLDPAAKAAAATVLASKLGADSGLKMFLGDEKKPNAPLGKSSDVEPVQSTGLRNRKPSHTRSHSTGSTGMLHFSEEATNELEAESEEAAFQNKMVEHYRGPPPTDGSILSRLVAFLVGEDPAQSYALICGNCRMHNGLARKEDFPYITYYCPHCHALNGPCQPDGHESGSSSGGLTPHSIGDANMVAARSVTGSNVRTNLETVQELDVGSSVTVEKEN